jgi:hypothetical protein
MDFPIRYATDLSSGFALFLARFSASFSAECYGFIILRSGMSLPDGSYQWPNLRTRVSHIMRTIFGCRYETPNGYDGAKK